MSDGRRVNIHATGLVLGEHGVMLRGPSGAGKSLLALELLDHFEYRGETALLVADDRLDLESDPEGLVMHAPPRIAGLIELRGSGIIQRPFVASARVDLVVDLVETLERMPKPSEFITMVEGLTLARCPVPRRGVVDSAHQRLLICQGLLELGHILLAQRQIST
jgi:HPr kinase/phosphorylase